MTNKQTGQVLESAEHRIGDTVRRGERLATEGNSGKSSGYHLDLRLLEENEDDRRVNTDRDAFYRRLGESFAAPSGGIGHPAGEREQVIRVVHEGLDRIQVTGDLEPGAAGRLQRRLIEATQGLGDELTQVRAPVNHHGF